MFLQIYFARWDLKGVQMTSWKKPQIIKERRGKKEKAVRLLCIVEGRKFEGIELGDVSWSKKVVMGGRKLLDVPMVQLDQEAYYTGRVTEANSQSSCGG
ncbi:hypothetical protein TB2_002866 [Malus domestica]